MLTQVARALRDVLEPLRGALTDAEQLEQFLAAAGWVSAEPLAEEVPSALADALAANRIKGAGLDAFGEEPLGADSPFWDLHNVLMTPHVGGQGGAELKLRLSELVRENTRRYLLGEPLKHVVMTPDGKLQGFGNP